MRLTLPWPLRRFLLGALLGKYKHAEVALPGGCNIGTRKIDLHIKGFKALGASVKIEHGLIIADAQQLRGAHIYLDSVSVGATINIMLAAALAEGKTVIENAAKEPHVVDVANFLNSMGANIKGAGTDVIRVSGVRKLHGSEYPIIPDQVEAGTFMFAAAITKGDVTVKNDSKASGVRDGKAFGDGVSGGGVGRCGARSRVKASRKYACKDTAISRVSDRYAAADRGDAGAGEGDKHCDGERF